MLFLTLLAATAVLTGKASAESDTLDLHLDSYEYLYMSPRDDGHIFRRQDKDNEACINSLSDQLRRPKPINPKFNDWLFTTALLQGPAELQPTPTKATTLACTATVPSSFSTDFNDYWSTYATYMSTVSDKAAQVTDLCGRPDFAFVLTQECEPSWTVRFEENGTVATSTVLPTFDLPPTSVVYVKDTSAGVRDAVVGWMAAWAGVLVAALMV